MKRRWLTGVTALIIGAMLANCALAQPVRKKIRLSLSSNNVALLPTFAAYDKGFFRDEGFDVELIHMAATLASTALMTGDLDYNGAATGVISAAVQGRPMKCLIFTVSRPLDVSHEQKEIKEPRDLKGKKVAGSTPGASATLACGPGAAGSWDSDPARDVYDTALWVARRRAVWRCSNPVRWTPPLLSVPENIVARDRGFNELLFLGDAVEFAQAGLGTTEKRIKENPDEVYRIVRAMLRSLAYLLDKSRHAEIVDLVMKRWQLGDRKMAEAIFADVSRVLAKDGLVSNDSIQLLGRSRRARARK